MLKKINSLSMPAQMMMIILICALLITSLYLLVFYPIAQKKYSDSIYSGLDSLAALTRSVEEYSDNESYAILEYNLSSLNESDNIYSICSPETKKEIAKLLETKSFPTYVNKATFSGEHEVYKEKGKRIYVTYFTFNTVKYAILTSDKTPSAFPRSQFISFTVVPMISAFVIPLFLVFMWLKDITDSINKVNHYLMKYDNDFSAAKLSNKQLCDLIENFKQYYTKMRQSDVEKQILFQNISHELKTPIATIKMYAEGIEDGLFKNNQLIDSAEVIIKQSNVLLGKVQKIMQMNKITFLEGDKKSIALNKVSISDVLFEELNKYNDIAPNVKFNVDLKNISFRGTKDIWENIFENIFDNNIRHGATVITITMADEYLMIENNGKKIDEALLPDKLFEPFKRGEGGNFGLGMTIIKRALELYDYKIALSNSEKGVVYMITDGLVK